LQRKNGHLANAIHQLRDVPTRRNRVFGGVHTAHDGACMIVGRVAIERGQLMAG
jgi:hypothetical protein